MRKLLFLIIIAVTFAGCWPWPEGGENKKYNYTIINNSGVTVEITPYLDKLKDINYKVILKPNEKINKTLADRPPYAGPLTMYSLPFPKFYKSNLTSIEITFNNSKKMIHEGCTQANQCVIPARDIFNPIFSDEQTETYIITPEDYQNAVDCGGNCN
jgi:hypothetical protein